MKPMIVVLAALLTALALATPASAWTYSAGGSAVCTEGQWVVTWTLDNGVESQPLTVTASSRNSVPGGSVVPARSTRSFTETLPGNTTGTLTLNVTANWPGEQKGQSLTVSVSLEGDCEGSPNPVTPPPPPPPGGGGGGGVSSAAPVPNVSITKQASAPSVALGQDITWTVNVSNSNAGPTAENVVVSDTIPAGVTYKSATPSQGGGCSFDSGTSKVTCSLGSLASNASATIAIVTTATTAGTYENVAVVTTTTPETTTSDNTATATSAGAPLAPPTVAPPAVSPAARICGSLAINVKRLTIGTRTVIRATVRDKAGKALGGVRVVVRGAGINAAAKAGKQGVARIAVIARSPGVVTVRVVGASVCSKRLGSLGEFQPPVTG